ncbi:MAG: histidine phosphatase family protein [Tissierellia bacterium]|nr:histidine phosphatase family protein [Tissierellia bacterium]
MDIILIRHGETEGNVLKNFSTKDTPLTDKGREQIERTRTVIETLSFDRVYVSPLKRAIETMEILGLDGEVENRIQEVDFGLFEGKTYETIKEQFTEEVNRWNEDIINYPAPKGESTKLAYKRVTSFLEEIVKKDEDVLLVCHDGVIRIALCWVFDNVEYFFKFSLDNGSISIITVNEDGFKYIKKMNYIGI